MIRRVGGVEVGVKDGSWKGGRKGAILMFIFLFPTTPISNY